MSISSIRGLAALFGIDMGSLFSSDSLRDHRVIRPRRAGRIHLKPIYPSGYPGAKLARKAAKGTVGKAKLR